MKGISIKEKIIFWLSQYGINRKTYDVKKIQNKQYKVIRGTIRDEVDKDDAWIFNLGANSKVIFDVGSNIGQSAMMFMHHESVERILLIDPNPLALAAAAENLLMNNLSLKASFIPAFLSDKENEIVDFYTVGLGAAGSKYKDHAKTAATLDTHFSVSTLTVDYLVKYYNVIPDLVKIDVEGAEVEVLNGSVALAAKRKAVFFVEVHSTNGIVANTEMILQWCKSNHYDAYYLKEHIILETDQIKARGRYHALLIPSGSAYPSYLRSIKQGDPIL
ncbi:MAG: FkbM family methyltransferase [Chryseolinea sp.]